MKTKIEEIDGKIIATLEGEFDTAAAMEVEEKLQPLFNSDGKDKNISYGAFARVFTMNEDDLSRYIDEHNPLSGFEPATGTQQADTTAGTQIQPADGDLMNDIQEEIIGSLSRIVKKQVGERTDSTTSDAINKIVDGVTDMIRNEVNR